MTGCPFCGAEPETAIPNADGVRRYVCMRHTIWLTAEEWTQRVTIDHARLARFRLALGPFSSFDAITPEQLQRALDAADRSDS